MSCNVSVDCKSEVCRNGVCTAIVQVAAGNGHACALLGDGTVFCWGANGGGQLGDGTTVSKPTATVVPGLSGVTQIALSAQISNLPLNGHGCARTNDGKLYCWGRNPFGQVGDGTVVDALSPKLILSADVAEVSAGRLHTCVRLNSGAVQCWGYNGNAQLGNGTLTNSSAPGAPLANVTAKSVSAGVTHTCAVLTSGELSCWGAGNYGQLGNGVITGSNVPAIVSGSANMLSVDTGFGFTCSVDAGGVLRCFGANVFGELGLGNTTMQTTPQVVTALTNVVGVACGTNKDPGAHTCAVRANGALHCWGYNISGQLGLSDTTDRLTPQAVNLPPVAEVTTGYQFTCARLMNGPIRCWGRNDVSQLGTGQVDMNIKTPTPVVFP
jgi:alpha-tubulin suppressor-like RCC1 family protein